MRKTILLASSAIALSCAACSSTIVVRRPATANDLLRARGEVLRKSVTAVVKTGDGIESVEGTVINFGRQTTTIELAPRSRLAGAEPSRQRSIPTEALREIVVESHVDGAVQGLGLGLLAGVAVGGLAGLADFTRNCPSSGCDPPKGVVGAGLMAVGGIAGVLLGSIIGGTAGARTTIEFGGRDAAPPLPAAAPLPEATAGERCPTGSIGRTARSPAGGVLECRDYFGNGTAIWIER